MAGVSENVHPRQRETTPKGLRSRSSPGEAGMGEWRGERWEQRSER